MAGNKLHSILKDLTRELVDQVTLDVKNDLRGYLWGELREAVKDVLKKDKLTQGSLSGFKTMEAIQEKYQVSKTTICKKCKKYNVERLDSGKYKLINELQFIEALKQKEDKPAFLSKSKAA